MRRARPSPSTALRRARRRLARLMLTALTVGSITATLTICARAVTSTQRPFAAVPTIVSVVDGDTVHVRIGRSVETVRLIGIDTPETKDPRRPVGCYGPEASARTHALLPVGTQVTLTTDAEPRDTYGRLLAYVVRIDDGTFINLTLAAEGFADVLTIPPNTAHTAEFRSAVDAARGAGLGLWSACTGH